MMIHEKILSGQFLLDLKNDHHTSMVHAQHSRLHHHQHQSLVPQITTAQLDIYSAYAYQQQLQQQLMGVHHQSPTYHNAAQEVLDLSRRCDSVEAPLKTPSPYRSTSSNGHNSPSGSPISIQQTTPQEFSAHPFYTHPSHTQGPHAPMGLAASLYPALYYSNVKQEPSSPPPSVAPAAPLPTSEPAPRHGSEMQVALPAPQSPIYRNKSPITTSTPTRSNTINAIPISSSPVLQPDAKATRPFKAFPRDPLVIAATFAATDVLLDNPRVERYTEYRKRVLEQIRSSNGGARTVTNPKMRRTNSGNGSIHEGCSSSNHNSESDERNAAEESSDCDSNAGNFEKLGGGAQLSNADANSNSINGSQVKDAAYYERRRKNNAAAKKSRDRRRIKEDEIAIRAAYLERQNIELLCQIDALKAQLATLVSKTNA